MDFHIAFQLGRVIETEPDTEGIVLSADKGFDPLLAYFNSTELKACDDAGITTFVPKPMTSGAKAAGRFDKSDFIYIARDDAYQCPAGDRAIYRFSTLEKNGLKAHLYWTSA